MATSSVIDLIEGNAAVPTAASKGLPDVVTHEDYLAAVPGCPSALSGHSGAARQP